VAGTTFLPPGQGLERLRGLGLLERGLQIGRCIKTPVRCPAAPTEDLSDMAGTSARSLQGFGPIKAAVYVAGMPKRSTNGRTNRTHRNLGSVSPGFGY